MLALPQRFDCNGQSVAWGAMGEGDPLARKRSSRPCSNYVRPTPILLTSGARPGREAAPRSIGERGEQFRKSLHARPAIDWPRRRTVGPSQERSFRSTVLEWCDCKSGPTRVGAVYASSRRWSEVRVSH